MDMIKYGNDISDKMVIWVKERILVPDFRDDLWNDQHALKVKKYIDSTITEKLFAYVDTKLEKLILTNSPPLASPHILEVTYFFKVEPIKITLVNISEIIQFGNLKAPQTALGVLNVVENIIYPHILKHAHFPHSIKRDISGYYHQFMATLTIDANQEQGKTILYQPSEIDSMLSLNDVEDKVFIQQLESIATQWIKQIKIALTNHETLCGFQINGPLDEIHFWRFRKEDLSSISSQLECPEISHILSILETSKSCNFSSIQILASEILKASEEAKDNVRFLDKIYGVCVKLANSEPADAQKFLPELLHRFRVVCTHSRYYNSHERIFSFLRKISSEVVHRCYENISLKELFNGDIENATRSLEDSIDCCESWKNTYKNTAAAINAETKSKIQWKFDERTLFALVDSFSQRCRDLIQISKAKKQFLRRSTSSRNGESGLILHFPGIKETEIQKPLMEIETLFKTQLVKLQRVNYDILDVKISLWHKDFDDYKKVVKDLDVMYANVINGAFAPITKIVDAVNLLQQFSSFTYRVYIEECLNKRKLQLCHAFIRYCQKFREDFEQNKRNPPLRENEPKYAGSVLWAQAKVEEVHEGWQSIKSLEQDTNEIFVKIDKSVSMVFQV